MKALIIEDEPLVCEYLKSTIAKLSETIEIVAELDTVASAVRWFEGNTAPDIAFMDIRLADGLSFDIFEKCNVTCPVIFTTAYDEYAIKAFQVHSVDYLLKPVALTKLQAAVEKFKQIRNQYSGYINKEIIPSLKTEIKTTYKSRFVVKVGEHLRMIPVEQILYFYSQNKATWICTSDGRHYPLDMFIDAVTDCVDLKMFFRINRKFLISLSAIDDVVVYSGSRLLVKLPHASADETIVSRQRVADFRKWMEG